MMAKFDIANESGSREVVAFSRTYDAISDLLVDDVPVVLIADISDDSDSIRIVADRLFRWDQERTLPEIAVLEFELETLTPDHLIELRSVLDEFSGITPVRLRFNSPQHKGLVSYDTDGIRLDKTQIDELRTHCPWLTTTVTIDTDKLLRERGDSYAYQAPVKQAAPAEVPF